MPDMEKDICECSMVGRNIVSVKAWSKYHWNGNGSEDILSKRVER